MKQLGFSHLQSDAGIFINKKYEIIIIAYVDDCIFMGKELKRVKQAKEAFMKIWECRDPGKAKEFLKMKIQHVDCKFILDQQDYLCKVVMQFNMTSAPSAQMPLPFDYKPEENKETATKSERLKYQSVIESLLQIMIGIQPNTSFVVIKIAQFSANYMLLSTLLNI